MNRRLLATLRAAQRPWFLGTPFQCWPDGNLEEAWIFACKCKAKLMALGVSTYCPIAECYGVAKYSGGVLDPTDNSIWIPESRWHRLTCHGLIVMKVPDVWTLSEGLTAEQRSFKDRGAPIEYVHPDDLG